MCISPYESHTTLASGNCNGQYVYVFILESTGLELVQSLSVIAAVKYIFIVCDSGSETEKHVAYSDILSWNHTNVFGKKFSASFIKAAISFFQ
jgi:hypothetical protein